MKTHILSVGLAKTGTMSLHMAMERSRYVQTPSKKKEIKALFNKDITFERYQREFDDVGAETFFESSPPYSHRGLAAYKDVLDTYSKLPIENKHLLINVRPIADRAFFSLLAPNISTLQSLWSFL